MLFNSVEFVLFFVLVLAGYWALCRSFRAQNTLIVIASYVFYGWWDSRFLYLIALSTAIDYSAGLCIDVGSMSRRQRATATSVVVGGALAFVVVDIGNVLTGGWATGAILRGGSLPRTVLIAACALAVVANLLHGWVTKLDRATVARVALVSSVVSNLGLLAAFKYYNFFADSLRVAIQGAFGVQLSGWTLDVVLPVGISFYTFQTMSYTIDIYRRQLRASTRLDEFAAYVAFFPQLVAGPIERAAALLPQFRDKRAFPGMAVIRSALWLIVWGYFKKLVVADNAAIIVGQVFSPYDTLSSHAPPGDGLRLLLGVYAFAIQIYGDFSGYTDIARGLARLLGFELMLNFKLPYFATDPSDFWSRWHISLSTWLRDYLYIPLGGNRRGPVRTYVNLALTMLLGGLWHGASWTFVLWGAFHGFILIVYRAIPWLGGGPGRSTAALLWRRFLMFHLTCLGWLIFRAQNVETIRIFLSGIFTAPRWSSECTDITKTLLVSTWLLIAMQAAQWLHRDLDPVKRWHWTLRAAAWGLVLAAIARLGNSGGREFIYFAF